MTHPFAHLHWEGPRHRVAEPSPQERRVKRLLRIAGRVHARATADRDRAIEDGQRNEMGVW